MGGGCVVYTLAVLLSGNEWSLCLRGQAVVYSGWDTGSRLDHGTATAADVGESAAARARLFTPSGCHYVQQRESRGDGFRRFPGRLHTVAEKEADPLLSISALQFF